MKTESGKQKAESTVGPRCRAASEPFFMDAIRRAQLLAVARTWLRTPFHAHAGIKGAGVDCVHLCAAIYIEAGALEVFNPPKYALDGGAHAAQSLITDWVEQCGRFEALFVQSSVPPRRDQGSRFPALQPGDLLCFTLGRVEWHVGILITPQLFIHAQRDLGVAENYLAARAWSRRLTRAYRPLNLGPRTLDLGLVP